MEALRQQYFMPLDGYLSRCRMLMHAGKKMLQVRLNISGLERDERLSLLKTRIVHIDGAVRQEQDAQ